MASPRLVAAVTATLLVATATVHAAGIHDAVKAGDRAQVEALIETDAALVNARDEDGRTPLHWAARGPDIALARLLVTRGADVNAVDARGIAPLHSLALRGASDGIRLLSAGGAKVDLRAPNGSTALHFAVLGGRTEAVRALLEVGAGLEAKDAYGRTPLSVAAREMAPVDVVRTLLDAGAAVDTTDESGATPLSLAAWRGSADVVDLLLQRGAAIPADGPERGRLLEEALSTGLDALFFRLLREGVELPRAEDGAPGLLAAAAEGGSARIIEALLTRGSSVGERDDSGWTPLHYAADMGRLPAIEILLARGADLGARTLMGQTVTTIAEDNDDSETLAFLAGKGAPQGPPTFPVLTGPYLGQKKPGKTAERFAPGIVSGRYALHAMPAFSPDGTEVFWRPTIPPRTPGYAHSRTLVSRLVNGRWTYPRRAVLGGVELEDVPFFHPDGTTLYDMAQRPLPDTAEVARGRGPERIWVWRKGPGGWTDPKPLDGAVNTVPHHWQFSVSRAGDVYFATTIPGGAGDSDIWRSRLVRGTYQTPENLGPAINTAGSEGTPYITPDGRTLLLSRDSDIYVSFLAADGTWTGALRLGSEVNTDARENLPSLSPDGAVMFFRRYHRCYWVDAGFLTALRAAELGPAGKAP